MITPLKKQVQKTKQAKTLLNIDDFILLLK